MVFLIYSKSKKGSSGVINYLQKVSFLLRISKDYRGSLRGSFK
jgi:hypothetical protein